MFGWELLVTVPETAALVMLPVIFATKLPDMEIPCAFAVIVWSPKNIVLPDRYISLQRLPALPKSYVTFALGFKLPVTVRFPNTSAPVAVARILSVEATVIETLPFVIIATLLVPLNILFVWTLFAITFPLASLTTTVIGLKSTEVSYPSSKSAFKFTTLVVEETVNGAVPVAILETSLEAVIVLLTFKRLLILVLPVTDKLLPFQVKNASPANPLPLLYWTEFVVPPTDPPPPPPPPPELPTIDVAIALGLLV